MNSKTSNASPPRSAVWPWAAIWCGAVLLRVVYFWQVRDTDLASALLGDANVYDAWAQRIAAGAWLGDKVFYQAPLYPYFLGVIYALGGHDLVLVRIVQIALGACSCVFLGKAAEHFFSRGAGYVAGVLMALCPTMIFFDCLVQKAVLDVFFFTMVCMLTAITAQARSKRRWWLVLGIASGLLALTRENALSLLPLLLLWAWQHGRLRAAALLAAGAACVLFPVAVRNRVVGGEFHLTTSQMGPNFYIGNNEHADGTYHPLVQHRGDPAFEQSDANELAQQELGHKLKPGEVSDFWMAKSFAFIHAQPWQWAKLMARKWFLVWNAAELGDTEEQGAYAQYSPVLRWLSAILHFGVLCPLAAMGVVWTWRRRRDLWILMAVALAYAASVTAFYVFARYRLLLFPLAIVFAAAGLVGMRDRMRWPLSASTWAGLITVLITAAWVNWPATAHNLDGLVTWLNLGGRFSKQHDYKRAVACFDKVLEQAPESDEAHDGKGRALIELKQFDEAIAELEIALRLNPRFPNAENNLGNALVAKGRASDAVPHYEKAQELKPQSAEIRFNLGNAWLQLGRISEAVACYEKAVELQPEFAEAHNNLGSLLLQSGRVQDAEPHFRKCVEIQPGNAGFHANLGVALNQLGRTTEAIEQYELAVAADPKQAAALGNLAWVLATCPDASVRNGARALELASKAAEATQHSNPGVLRVLAAALAENGSFHDAVNTAESALNMCEAQGNHGLAAAIRKERESYLAGQPYRDVR